MLSWQVDTLRLDLDGLRASLKRSEDEKKALEARIAELQREPGGVAEGSVREQERAAGESRVRSSGAASRPALPATAARGGPFWRRRSKSTTRRSMPGRVPGCGKLYVINGERILDPDRDRRQGPHTQDRPSPVAPQLRLRIVASGSVGAPGAEAVPQDALRDQRVGARAVRALRLPAAL